MERLRDAAAEGRLEHIELDARVERALTAKTYADLAALTADLPPEPSADPGEPLLLKGGLHGAARTGRWRVPARIAVYGGMGGARLDFTRTATRLAEVEVEAHGQWAGVTIVIPDGWGAETGGAGPWDRRTERQDHARKAPGYPVTPPHRDRRNSWCHDPAPQRLGTSQAATQSAPRAARPESSTGGLGLPGDLPGGITVAGPTGPGSKRPGQRVSGEDFVVEISQPPPAVPGLHPDSTWARAM